MKTRWSLPPGNLGEQGRPFFQSSESKCQDVRQEAENGPCGSKETQSSNPLRDPPSPHIPRGKEWGERVVGFSAKAQAQAAVCFLANIS